MVGLSSGIFYCVLLTPSGKILECRAGHVILPGHDGLIGILRNHAPMLYELGRGIMQVKDIAGRGDAFYLIDGGFARVSENLLTVLAYDVTTFEGMEHEAALELISRAKSVIVGGGYVRQTEKMEVERARLVVRMGEMASLEG